MKLHPDSEKRKPAAGYVAAPFHLTQNDRVRPGTCVLFRAARPAIGKEVLHPHHNRGTMDESLRAFKACAGMAEVAHPGVVLFRLVEVRPFDRRAAGKPLILSFLFRMSHLRKSRDELELEVARRTAEIQKLQERLQVENIDLKEDLAGAHTYGGIIGESLLNVFPIEIMPLRDRKEDIPLLATHFIEVFSRRLNRPVPRLTEANLIDLKAHDWPGNVRELQNIIERALILSPHGRLHFDLPRVNGEVSLSGQGILEASSSPAPRILTEAEIAALQKQNVLAALIRSDWKIYGKGGAAELLGIKPTTLIERMRRLMIKRPS